MESELKDIKLLKQRMNEFKLLDPQKQRNILGEIVFPMVEKECYPNNAPRITGMLIDLEV